MSILLITVLCTQIFVQQSFANASYSGNGESVGVIENIKKDTDETYLTEENILLFQQEFKKILIEDGQLQSSENPKQIDNRRRGPKTKIVKIAAKKMLKKLTHLGKNLIQKH